MNLKNKPFKEAIGSIMYAAYCRLPDNPFAVGNLASFSNNLSKTHWIAVKRVLRCLKETSKLKLTFKKFSDHLHAYCDSDLDDRKTTAGYVFLSSGGAISWVSKKQPTVALSSP